MPTRPATTAELIELLAPFAGAKLNRPRDPASRYGAYLPQAAAVDILATVNAVNADVRRVTDEGVEIFFYDRCHMVRWADVRRVTVRELNRDGTTAAQVVWEHRAEQARRAA